MHECHVRLKLHPYFNNFRSSALIFTVLIKSIVHWKHLISLLCPLPQLGFSAIKVKGKRSMSGADFYNGFLSKPAFKNEHFQSLPNNINADIFSSRLRRSIESVGRDDFVFSTFGYDSALVERRGPKKSVQVI